MGCDHVWQRESRYGACDQRTCDALNTVECFFCEAEFCISHRNTCPTCKQVYCLDDYQEHKRLWPKH